MKRAQAALEFLTTYGWAFMIIVIVFGTVSYVSIMNPSVFIPERCVFSTDVRCEDFMISSIVVPSFSSETFGMVLIDVKQNLGRTAYITDFSCGDATGGQVFGYHQEGTDFSSTDNSFADTHLKQWDPGIRVTLKCFFNSNPFTGREGESINIPLVITLQTREDGFNHSVQGELIGKIQ